MRLKERAKLSRGLATAFVGACFIAFSGLMETGAVTQNNDQSLRIASKSKDRKNGSEDGASAAGARAYIGRAVMWREPVDIRSRDLFYGIGGRKGVPDISTAFTFVKHSESGTQKKIIVKDVRGREWTVKFGREARPETVSTRIVWAVGYHTDQDYFVRQARIVGKENIAAHDVRFERRDDGFEEDGNWSWKENPFVGTRELAGMKILMALLKNWDVKSTNNEIARRVSGGQSGMRIYYVSDLGASLGQTGTWVHKIPLFGDLPASYFFASGKAKGDPDAFADEKFIKGVEDGKVIFYHRRARGRSMLKDISVGDARWMGGLLGQLSNKQLADAVRAGGYEGPEAALYMRVLRERIKQLQSLR
ncbi:MAG TPA: hypothetical protein VJ810_27765 [Blastocatellia bacterium]|nr:hypothetical protein [Blastocatellia bacterium]